MTKEKPTGWKKEPKRHRTAYYKGKSHKVKKEKLYLLLSHQPNFDTRDGESSGFGYWSGIKRPKPKRVIVYSFKEASKIATAYINKYDLAIGNWNGGAITDAAGESIAHVSYKGRVWDNHDTRLLYEKNEL
jgi:hypothetical protein